jgi:hypothetical protein
MYIRRALFYWQFIAAVLLPAWVLVARGLILSDVGWDFLLYLLLCPLLFVAMMAVAGLTTARKAVRSSRSVSWRDAAVLLVWHALIVTYGFIASSALATLIVLVGVLAFWNAAYELYTETRTRVKNALSLDPLDQGAYRVEPQAPDAGRAPDASRVIIINPDGSREELPDR